MGVLTADSVRSGQVVRFSYNGGEKSGFRLVEVTENDGSYIKGYDKEKNEFRQYRRDRITSAIELVADTHEELVPLKSFLVDTTVPIERAASIYRLLDPERSPSLRFSTTANVLVVRRKDLPRIDVTITKDKVSVDFISLNGLKTGVWMTHTNPAVQAETVYTCTPSVADFNRLVTSLNDQNHGRGQSRVFQVDANGATNITPAKADSWEARLLGHATLSGR